MLACQSNGLKENDWFKNNNLINLTYLIGVFILYYVLIGHNTGIQNRCVSLIMLR